MAGLTILLIAVIICIIIGAGWNTFLAALRDGIMKVFEWGKDQMGDIQNKDVNLSKSFQKACSLCHMILFFTSNNKIPLCVGLCVGIFKTTGTSLFQLYPCTPAYCMPTM
jgi:hypothetical protein